MKYLVVIIALVAGCVTKDDWPEWKARCEADLGQWHEKYGCLGRGAEACSDFCLKHGLKYKLYASGGWVGGRCECQ